MSIAKSNLTHCVNAACNGGSAAADNTDTENLVFSVRRTLGDFVGADVLIDLRPDRAVRPYAMAFDIFRAGIKICGVLREHAGFEQAINIRLELYLDVILVDHQIQAIPLQRALFQNSLTLLMSMISAFSLFLYQTDRLNAKNADKKSARRAMRLVDFMPAWCRYSIFGLIVSRVTLENNYFYLFRNFSVFSQLTATP